MCVWIMTIACWGLTVKVKRMKSHKTTIQVVGVFKPNVYMTSTVAT